LRILTRQRSSGPTRCTPLRRSRPGLAALSTLMQLDLSTYDLDAPLPAAL
jgi:hypothetical protein